MSRNVLHNFLTS